MLIDETDAIYYVLAPWAIEQMPYTWRTLRQALEDPLGSDLLERIASPVGRELPDEDYWRSLGFTINAPHEVTDGPFGGGIIRVDLPLFIHVEPPLLTKWLPENIIGKDGSILDPDDVRNQRQAPACNVFYIEPSETAESLLGLAKKPVRYVPRFTIEHVLDLEGAYWVFRVRGKELGETLLQTAQECACGLGFVAKLTDELPKPVRARTAELFTESRFHTHWLRLPIETEQLGRIWAASLYAGLHVRQVFGRAIESVHLFATLATPTKAWDQYRFR